MKRARQTSLTRHCYITYFQLGSFQITQMVQSLFWRVPRNPDKSLQLLRCSIIGGQKLCINNKKGFQSLFLILHPSSACNFLLHKDKPNNVSHWELNPGTLELTLFSPLSFDCKTIQALNHNHLCMLNTPITTQPLLYIQNCTD